MKFYLRILICLPLLFPLICQADSAMPMRHMTVDTSNQQSLVRGAHEFANYCFSCHEARQVRYKQIMSGLGLTKKQMKDKLNLPLPGRKIGGKMTVSMTSKEGKKWFGISPPDLSDIERIRGANWLYTYLTSFYVDPSRKSGVNNVVFPKVAMPDVIWHQQGLQKPVYKTIKNANGKSEKVISGLKLVQKGTMTPKQYDRTVRDLVNFLAYMSAPYKHKSHITGYWVIALLLLFTISAYLLKREYWKDVDH